MEVGQESGSSERMGGYDPFIFLLCFIFLSVHVAVVYSCCCTYYSRYVSYVLSYLFFYLIYLYVSAVRSMLCLLVSLVKSKRFICYYLYVSAVVLSRRLIYCFPYVSVVLFHRLTCTLLFIAVLRYMFCLVIMFHILCFYIFNNHMFYMFIDHKFHIAMNMFHIMISMINYIIYVIIIMLIYGIKMIWKLPNYLTCSGSHIKPHQATSTNTWTLSEDTIHPCINTIPKQQD